MQLRGGLPAHRSLGRLKYEKSHKNIIFQEESFGLKMPQFSIG
jgi:hypothetical protein